MKVEVYDERDEWLANRGLGGSDMAAAMGRSPFKSAYTCAAEKAGLIAPEDISDRWVVRRGNYFEPAVLEMWRDETGMFATRTPFTIFRDEEFPFLTVTPDAMLEDGVTGVEIKTTSRFGPSEWEDGVPLYAQIQIQACMMLTGAEEWHYAALTNMTDPPKIGIVARNSNFIDAMRAEAVRFWNEHVIPKRPPAPDGTESTTRAIARIFPKPSGEGTVLGGEFYLDSIAWAELSAELAAANKRVADLKKARNLHANRLRAAIGDASYGRIDGIDDGYFTLNETHRPGKYRRASRYRTLHWKKEKKT